MKRLLNKLLNYKGEPARVVSKLTVAASGLFALASLWDIPVSDRHQDQILKTLVVAVPATIGAIEWVRSQVTPTTKATAAVETALQAPAPTTVETTKATAAGILATTKAPAQ